MDRVQIVKPQVFIFEGINHISAKMQDDIAPIVESITNLSRISYTSGALGVVCPTQSLSELIGLFPANIPILTEDKLQDIDHWDAFLTQLYTLQRLEYLQQQLTHHEIIQFHSRHKYLIMAYSPVGYQLTGRLVAGIRKGSDLTLFFNQYKACLMEIFATVAPKNIQVNALSHMQGYFKHKATQDEKKRLLWLINDYREGNLPINRPLMMMQQLLQQYPDSYLQEQYFFAPYPNCDVLRESPYRW
jgi:uncharacterized protein YbgA (DUF1722 family)